MNETEVLVNAQPRKRPGLTVTDTPEGLAVTDSDFGAIHLLNGTAAAVFLLCDGQTPLVMIAGILQEAFSLETAPVDDVAACVRQLIASEVLDCGELAAPVDPQAA